MKKVDLRETYIDFKVSSMIYDRALHLVPNHKLIPFIMTWQDSLNLIGGVKTITRFTLRESNA